MDPGQFAWFVHALLALVYALALLGLVLLIRKILGVEPIQLLLSALIEVKDLARGRISVGSLNLLGVLVTALFGALVIGVHELHYFVEKMERWIGKADMQYAQKSIDWHTLIYFLGVIFIVSLLVVIVVHPNMRGRK